MIRGRHGHVKERLRLFFSVWLDTDSAEDAMWAVLEADRRDRDDAKRRLREGRPFEPDPVADAIVREACAEVEVDLEAFLEWHSPGSRSQVLGRARAIAARALRDEGYSYRAIGTFMGCAHCTVMQALARAAGNRALVAATRRVLARAKRGQRRLVAV